MRRLADRPVWSRTLIVVLGTGLMASAGPAGARAQDTPSSAGVGLVVSWGGPVDLQADLTPPAGLDDAVAIAASDLPGTHASLAVRADGRVVGWGVDEFGEAHPPDGLQDVVAVDI